MLPAESGLGRNDVMYFDMVGHWSLSRGLALFSLAAIFLTVPSPERLWQAKECSQRFELIFVIVNEVCPECRTETKGVGWRSRFYWNKESNLFMNFKSCFLHVSVEWLLASHFVLEYKHSIIRHSMGAAAQNDVDCLVVVFSISPAECWISYHVTDCDSTYFIFGRLFSFLGHFIIIWPLNTTLLVQQEVLLNLL